MPKIRIEVDGFRCARCGHEWIPRKPEHPRVCPKCKNPFWDSERSIQPFRADVTIQWLRGFQPDRRKIAALEKQLGIFRHPQLAWVGKRLRVGVDLQAMSPANAEIQARRLVVSRLRAEGLSGSGVTARIAVTVKPTD
jgi:hypothetical protein